MVSELELKVREMDDPNIKIYEMSRQIAKKLKASLETVYHYLIAKRQGLESNAEYLRAILKKRGINSISEYESYKVLKRGFLGKADYANYLYHKKRNRVKNKEEYFEGSWKDRKLDFQDSRALDNIQSDKDYSLISILEVEDRKEEIKFLLNITLERLYEKWRKVLIGRFYEGKTFEEIGKDLNLTRERVRQIEEKALQKFYLLAKQSGLYDLYVEKE